MRDSRLDWEVGSLFTRRCRAKIEQPGRFEDFGLKAKARIRPGLSYMYNILLTEGLDGALGVRIQYLGWVLEVWG